MDKAVLVYGIGISGCGAAEILARGGKRVLLYNDAEHEVNADLKELLAKTGGQIVIGGGEKLLVSQANMTGEELPATLTPGQQVMVSWSRDVMVPLVEER